MYSAMVLTFGSLVITSLSILLAIEGRKWLYWVGGISMYFFSFMTGFSIGLYALGISFAIFALALAHTMKWITSFRSSFITVIIALAIWGASIMLLDDAVLFLPIILILKAFGLS